MEILTTLKLKCNITKDIHLLKNNKEKVIYIINKIAILLSAEEYKIYKPTPYCINDMNELRSTLIDYCDFYPNNVISIPLNPYVQITPKEILLAISEKIESCKKGDVFLFFYAGHGHYDKVKKTSYLILPKTTEDFENTAIRLSDICNILKKKEIVNIRIFDACHSGHDSRNSLENTLNYKEFARDISLYEGEGWITFAACKEEECSYSDPNLKHGIFTYYFIDAIKSFDLGEYIYPELLKISVFEKVKEHCKNKDLKQTPTFNASVSGNVILAKSKNISRNNSKNQNSNNGHGDIEKNLKNLTSKGNLETEGEYKKRLEPYLGKLINVGKALIDKDRYNHEGQVFYFEISWDDWFYEFKPRDGRNGGKIYYIEVNLENARKIANIQNKYDVKVKLSRNENYISIEEVVLETKDNTYIVYGVVTDKYCRRISINEKYNNYLEPAVHKNEIYFLNEKGCFNKFDLCNNQTVKIDNFDLKKIRLMKMNNHQVCYIDDTFNLYNYIDFNLINLEIEDIGGILDISISNIKKYVSLLKDSNCIEIWDIENKKQIIKVEGNKEWKRKWYKKLFARNNIKELCFNDDDSILAFILDKKDVVFFDINNAKINYKYHVDEKIFFFEFLPNSELVMIVTNHKIKVFNYIKGKLVKEIDRNYDDILYVKTCNSKDVFMTIKKDSNRSNTEIKIYNYNLFLLNTLSFNNNKSNYDYDTENIKDITYVSFSEDNKYIIVCDSFKEFYFLRWS
ncbi:caspase family protein [Clostridium tagluense]|uniref:caspase family protein n=1 Tax=Clostridium tagluense TaxID=360422 RepID=UPI001C6EB83D|nr:caspase family protein [Clostridium tagluense]MBW9155507.1 caspase family protein [Clostridium tagluense]WLC66135.1 caspase family protein [Clostridium tagluense]